MTKQTLIAYAKLAALTVLKPIPLPVARVMLRPFARWLWPSHPTARMKLRREVARAFAEGLKPDRTSDSSGPRL